jgi:hypothetical protein
MDLHFCIDCNAVVEATKHRKCSVCQSSAIMRLSAQHPALLATLWPEERLDPVAELERIWRL